MSTDRTPDHQRIGYGSLAVGEALSFTMTDLPAIIRNRLSAYAGYTGKRFRTRTDGNIMHITRVK